MSTRPTLASLLRGRSRADVAAFVAALYAARGADTSVTGDVVVVDGDRVLVVASRRIAVADRLRPPWSTPRRRIDHVVAVDATRAARIAARYDAAPVSAADLDRLARYGLDRTTADALYRDQFGLPVSAVAPQFTSASAATTGSGSTPRSSVPVTVIAVLAALVLFGATLSGVGVATSSFPWAWDAPDSISVSPPLAPEFVASDDGATGGAAGDDDTGTTATADPGSETDAPAGDTADDVFAPGLSTSGVTDASALAAAHGAAIGNSSYRWELSYVESVNGSITASGIETVRVGSRRRFVSTVLWSGEPVGYSPVATRSSYADGTVRYRPAADGSGVVTRSLTDFSSGGEQGWRASRYLSWYLSAQSSTIEQTLIHTAHPTAVVVLNGTAYPTVEQYSARALVTSEGFVQSLSVSYVLIDQDDRVHVRFTFHYVDEDVSVSPPTWYTADEARQAG